MGGELHSQNLIYARIEQKIQATTQTAIIGPH
jgi:hypothetical protein